MNASQHLRIYKAAIAQMVAHRSLVLESKYIDSAINAAGLTRKDVATQAQKLLRTSAASVSAEEIEALLTLAGDLTTLDDGIATYNSLLLLRNHEKHEDIVRILQDAADPCSVPALVSTLESEHVIAPWDEGKALARKCFWALATIGSEEAWQAIGRYSDSDDPVLLQWANEQIERRRP